MGYRDIKLSKQPKTYKENLTPVFSDLIGEMEGQGKVDNFIDDSLNNLGLPSNITSDPFEIKFNGDLRDYQITIMDTILKEYMEKDIVDFICLQEFGYFDDKINKMDRIMRKTTVLNW